MEKTNTNAISIGLLGIIVGLIVGLALNGTSYGRGMMNMMGVGGMMNNNGFRSGIGMEEMMHGMTGGLEGLSGDSFDRAFLLEMTIHHQGAIEMARQALANAKHEEIKEMAKAIISAQTREIGQMEEWQKSWYTR